MSLTYDNPMFVTNGNLVEISKMEIIIPKITRQHAKQFITETHKIIRQIEQDDPPEGLVKKDRNIDLEALVECLYEGISVFDEFFPNLALEAEVDLLERYAMREILRL